MERKLKALVWWVGVVLGVSLGPPAGAAERTFSVSGTSVVLPDVSGQVAVLFRDLRLNRAIDAWEISLLVSNAGPRTVRAPLFFRAEQLRGVAGFPATAAFADTDGKLVLDLSELAGARGVAAGRLTAPLTFAFPRGTGAFELAGTPYGRADSGTLRWGNGNAAVVLEEAPAELPVFFRALRPNRVTGGWAVDLVVSNATSSAVSGPLVFRFDEASAGLGRITGAVTNDGALVLDLSGRVPVGGLAPRAVLGPVTLDLGKGTGQPLLRGVIFRPPPTVVVETPLFAVRTLDGNGLPRAGVAAEEIGSATPRTIFAGRDGWLTLPGADGLEGWQFTASDRVPVTRVVPARDGAVTELVSVRLPDAGVNGEAGGGLGPQNLPGPLPSGWSPLAVAMLDAGGASLSAADGLPLAAGEVAAVARWNDAARRWEVVSTVPTPVEGSVAFTVSNAGVHALVVADAGGGAPSTPVPGQALGLGSLAIPATATWSASGRVVPASRPANRGALAVTAQGEVTLRSSAGGLPSGTAFRCEVREEYRLRDGRRRLLPVYTAFLTGYRRPGAGDGSVLARFPLRPVQLLGADELAEATIRVSILPASAFAGGVLPAAGGGVADGGIEVVASAGVLEGNQAATLRVQDVALFTNVVAGGSRVAAAFELALAGVRPGQRLEARFPRQTAGTNFVLARSVYDAGVYGLQPVTRFTSGGDGTLSSEEPAGDAGLAGVDGGGQFLLIEQPAGAVAVRGVVRDGAGQPVPGAVVEAAPWLAFADGAGNYRILVPSGGGVVTVRDPANGNTGLRSVTPPSGSGLLALDLVAAPAGPRVVALSPVDGATNVARVAPVTVTFSEPVNPASLVAVGAVLLLDTNDAPVTASVSLNLAGNTVTLLPTAALPPSQRLRLKLAATITDLGGMALEGPSQFAFTTGSDGLDRGAAAQLIVFEPGARKVPGALLDQVPAYDPDRDRDGIVVQGTQGTAEPGGKVILVNESTGETATVLAGPDGSFVSLVRGAAEDFISAVMVNANGTRNTVPVSRQQFDDGSVGLYRGGGKLEAQSDGGPVEVIVPPGAIPERTRFRVEAISLSTIQALLAASPPAGATALGAFRFETEGDALREPATVRFPASAAAVGAQPGQAPEDVPLLIVRPTEVEGATVYEVIDSGRFDGSALVAERELTGFTEGEPLGTGTGDRRVAAARTAAAGGKARVQLNFFGAAVAPFLWVKVNQGIRRLTAKAVGQVTSFERDAGGNIVESSRQPVVGATVRSVNSGTGPGRRVVPGDLVALTDTDGRYRVLSPLTDNVSILQMESTSPLFATQIATGRRTVTVPVDAPDAPVIIRVDLAFQRGEAGAPANDREPPIVRVSHNPDFIATNLAATVRVFANDDLKLSTLAVSVAEVRSTNGTLLANSAVALALQSGAVEEPQTIRRNYDATSTQPVRAVVRALATDAAGKSNEVRYAFSLPAGEALPPLDTNDVVGPFITGSTPEQRADRVPLGSVIRLQFSEAIFRDVLDDPSSYFTLTPAAGTPNCRLLDGDSMVELSYYKLDEGTTYTLSVSTLIKDRNGNRFDQNPYNNPLDGNGNIVRTFDSFALRFTMADFDPRPLPGVLAGIGTAQLGDLLVVIDRGNAGSQGMLRVYDVSDPLNPTQKNGAVLQEYPRAFTLVTNFSYRPKPGQPVQTADLVLVAGGTVGGLGQWIEGYRVNPNGTLARLIRTTLTDSPAAAVTKLEASAPRFGFLLSDADQTAVGLVDLQLLLLVENFSPAEFKAQPAGGDPGLDANGDGDYVDDQDRLPLPDGSRPRLGVVNGGLLANYLVPGDPGARIRDFDLAFQGNFLGVIDVRSDRTYEYRTLVTAGSEVPDAAAGFGLGAEPKRVKVLFGVPLETDLAGQVLANVAIVTMAGGGEVRVLDITDPKAPVQLNSLTIPAEHGQVQIIEAMSPRLISLGTAKDLLLLDPRKLALLPASGNIPPALVGWYRGFGGATHPYVASEQPLYAVASGAGRVAGFPKVIDLVAHQPGAIGAPGAIVPESDEGDDTTLLAFVNDDFDGARFSAVTPNQTRDHARVPHSLFDNDLVQLVLRQPPLAVGGTPVTRARLKVRATGTTGDLAQFVDHDGYLIPPTSGGAAAPEVVQDLSSDLGALAGLRNGAVTVYLEGLAPARGVEVVFEVLDNLGSVLGSDSVKVTFLRATMTQMWSEQFPGSKSNLFPGNAGGDTAIIMGNRTNGYTHVGGKLELEPDDPAFRRRLLARLYIPHEGRLVGDSTWTGTDVSVKALDDRSVPFSVTAQAALPLLFNAFVAVDSLRVEEFLVFGLDGNRDGDLALDEVRGGFNTTTREGRLWLHPFDYPNAFSEPHFKVVSQALYDSQKARSITLLVTFNNLTDLTDIAKQNLLGPDSEEDAPNGAMPIAANMFYYFINRQPANVRFTPDSVSTYDVPDRLQHEPGMVKLGHQTGPFGANGKQTVPRLIYGPTHVVSLAIRDSNEFRAKLKSNVASNSVVVAAIRQAASQASGAGQTTFNVNVTVGFSPATSADDRKLLSGSFAGKDSDLYYGFGGFIAHQLELHLAGTFTAGQPITITGGTYQAIVQDLYDWDLGINPLGWILQAGYDTYGTAGQVWVNEAQVQGSISQPISVP